MKHFILPFLLTCLMISTLHAGQSIIIEGEGYACMGDDKSLLQLLPNPYRDQNYFNGGVVYEIPSGDDRFDLEVSPPYGTENVTVYASTSPTGSLDVKPAGGVFSIANKLSDISAATRGVKFVQKDSGKSVAEFAEATATAVTKGAVVVK